MTSRPIPTPPKLGAVIGFVFALAAWGCGGPGEVERDRPVAGNGGGPRVEVRASGGLEELARRVGSAPGVWRSLPGISDSVLAGRHVIVWFVRDLTTLDSVGLGRPEPWVAGVADSEGARIALRVDGPQQHLGRLRAVYRHEAAHVALAAATGGNAPRWLHEGYAQLASGTWDWREGWRLQFILLRGGHSMLSELDRRFRSGLEPQTAYILSYTAVDALYALGGEAGLAALFEELGRGRRFDAALRRVFGLTAEQFERRWRDRVLDRYGWLYLLSRTAFVWLGVTLLIIALGIARVRRDRRRLAEMREQERWEAREGIEVEMTDVDDPSKVS